MWDPWTPTTHSRTQHLQPALPLDVGDGLHDGAEVPRPLSSPAPQWYDGSGRGRRRHPWRQVTVLCPPPSPYVTPGEPLSGRNLGVEMSTTHVTTREQEPSDAVVVVRDGASAAESLILLGRYSDAAALEVVSSILHRAAAERLASSAA